MKSLSEKMTNVRVHASDGLVEISIVDSQFDEVASGFGFLATRLKPGIYKVLWAAGSSVEDKLIEVTGNEDEDGLTVDAQVSLINTSAPLNNTKFGCVSEPGVLEELSMSRPTVGADKTSQVLIFLRDEEGMDSQFPVESITVHSASGEQIAGLADGVVDIEDRYAGILIGVDPGVYRLRVETGLLGSYDAFVFASERWQTRVFLTCDEFYYGSNTFRRPTLRSMSVLLGRIGQVFDPGSHDARLAELALQALLQGQDVLASDDMHDLLYGKFEDPMLGVYAAHLLLQKKPVRWRQFEIVCRNLRRLVGRIPDVQALETRRGQAVRHDEDSTEHSLYVGLPPMLIRSWDLLVKHSRKRYKTIPSGSLADRIAGSVVSTKPWLMCRVASEVALDETRSPSITVAKAKRVVRQMIDQVSPSDSEDIRAYLDDMQEELDPIERAILDVVAMTDGQELLDESGDTGKYAVSGFESSDISQQLRKIGIADSTVPQIQAPSYSIARSAMTLASKLSEKFDLDMS